MISFFFSTKRKIAFIFHSQCQREGDENVYFFVVVNVQNKYGTKLG